MMNEIRYEPYHPSYFRALQKLYKIVWGKSRSDEYDSKLWNETIIGVCPAILAFCCDELVGFYMVWPIPLTDGQERILGGQPVDSMVHPSFQGRGMLRELACRCYELCGAGQIQVMFGAPNRAAYSGNVGALNWCHVGSIWEHLRPLSPTVSRDARWVERSGAWLSGGYSGRHGIEVRRDFSIFADELQVELAPVKRRWQVDRTAQWLTYRYRSVIGAEYYTVSARGDGGARGSAVCGLRQSSLGSVATLAEVIATDGDMRKALVAATASWARHRGARFLLAKSTATLTRANLLQYGFAPFRRTPLISRTLGWRCFSANPFSSAAWALFGGDFDTM